MEKIDLFIGPCVLESKELGFTIAEYLKENIEPLSDKLNISFKASFDKANRSSIDSYRGPGIEEGLRNLQDIKKEFGFDLITDFHLPDQAQAVSEVVDTIQVPAFLCRQTDMLVSAGTWAQKNNCRVKVKKGQFLSPSETRNIVEKLTPFIDKDKILLTERGSSFGYQNLVVDMTSFKVMKSFGVKTIHDATHCVQRPGGLGKATAGNREFIEVLARAALAAGANGLFMETHPDPASAKSDATTCLSLEALPKMISNLIKVKELTDSLGEA